MVSRDEYERIIESFLMEMQAICAGLRGAHLEQFPTFVEELQEAKSLLCNPVNPDEAIVGYAFGVVDEFVHVDWVFVMRDSYALYVDLPENKLHHHAIHSRRTTS